jgi:RNA polymerase sigma-70 factor (ECF subfamily)
MLEQCPDQGGEDSVLFDAEYRGRLIAWAAERIRGEFSETAWQAFWRSTVDGRTAKEVADCLGISLGTVYQYKSRVVVRIRRELAQFEWESIGDFSEVTQWYRDGSTASATNPD